jgi:hypothetical protein
MPHALQDYATLPLPLTTNERQELSEYEATIEYGLNTFFEVGIALGMIRRKKLYRVTHRTFEDYCREKWNIDRSSAYRFMEAAETKENVSAIADIQNVGQARALEGLSADEQRQVIQRAIATAPAGKFTAKHLKDVRQQEIPMPAPKAEQPVSTPVKQMSVCIPQRTPMSNPAYEEREDWTCRNCQKHFDDEFGFFYPSGRALCLECIETNDPCAACKSAHSECNGCCDQCKHFCNGAQLCRLNVNAGDDDEPDDREPEAVIKDSLGSICAACGTEIAPGYEEDYQGQTYHANCHYKLTHPEKGGVSGTCHFCGIALPEDKLYSATAQNGYVLGHICRACAAKALHELLDPHDPEVIADAQINEQTVNDPPFGCSAYRDRMKLLNAGLRVFRADGHDCTLKEFKLSKTNVSEGSWQKYEQFPTQAAVKRRIQELDQDDHIVFESRL